MNNPCPLRRKARDGPKRLPLRISGVLCCKSLTWKRLKSVFVYGNPRNGPLWLRVVPGFLCAACRPRMGLPDRQTLGLPPRPRNVSYHASNANSRSP